MTSKNKNIPTSWYQKHLNDVKILQRQNTFRRRGDVNGWPYKNQYISCLFGVKNWTIRLQLSSVQLSKSHFEFQHSHSNYYTPSFFYNPKIYLTTTMNELRCRCCCLRLRASSSSSLKACSLEMRLTSINTHTRATNATNEFWCERRFFMFFINFLLRLLHLHLHFCCVCVCVCMRKGDKKREKKVFNIFHIFPFFHDL